MEQSMQKLGMYRKLLFKQAGNSFSACHKKHLLTSCVFKNPAKNVYNEDSIYYTNPLERLQPFLQVSIIPEADHGFQPTLNEIKKGADVFKPKNYKGENFTFRGSFPTPELMPQYDVPEVTFIGKSNVGKSSLLAALFTDIPALKVRTSSKPGHTKMMNIFNVNNIFHCVDMPGYGFNMPAHFEQSVEAYLRSRRCLQRAFLLIDATSGPSKNDYVAVKMLEDFARPYVIVLTKIDMAPQGVLLRNLASVLRFMDSSEAHCCFPQPFLVSSITGEGVHFLQTFIAYITGNLQLTNLL